MECLSFLDRSLAVLIYMYSRFFFQLVAHKFFAASLLAFVLLYTFLYGKLEQSIFSHNDWDSYTLQAQRWWQGKTDLGQDYTHLELAYYNDRVFVSFPPVPSLVMALLVPLFGAETPSNAVSTLYAIGSFIVLYFLMLAYKQSKTTALFWTIFAVVGSNFLWISTSGGVWFQAQGLSFFLTSLSLLLVSTKRDSHYSWALCALALAVGCRPFQAIYFPVIVSLWWYHTRNDANRFSPTSLFKLFLPSVCVATSLAAYNMVRFHNPVEFGHNYLKEFTEAVYGQFHFRYIGENWRNLFRLPYWENGTLTFPRFDGFALWLANPIFISLCARLYKMKTQTYTITALILPVLFLLHTVLILSHKTLGGWQFGNRYFVDLIPMIVLFIVLVRPQRIWGEWILLPLASALNIYGTLWLFLNWP